MQIQKININKIKINPNNPRIIKNENFNKLVQSVKDFPEMLEIRPIVVNSEMVILGGNMRYKACKEVGIKEISIIIADNLTEQQQKEFLIKDNVSGGDWDWEMLANEWNNNDLENWGLLNEKKSFDLKEFEINQNSEIYLNVKMLNEKDAEKLFNELQEKGFECKIIS